MFATTNPKEPNAEPNKTTNVSPCQDGRDYDTLDDLERCRAEENRLQEARGKGTNGPASEVSVLIHGNQRTFELRERLKAAGLHWLKDTRAWSGSVPCEFVPQMEAEGLQVVPLVPEGHPLDRHMQEWRREQESPAPPSPSPRAPARKPRARPGKAVTVKVSEELRVAAFLPEHGWALQDITANLADDARKADEHRVERHLQDLRSRVKAARALISADPTIRQTLTTNPEKAAAFYAIHGVTEAQVRHGVPDVDVSGMEWEDLVEVLRGRFPGAPVSADWVAEEAERAAAVFPGSEEGA